MVNSVVSKCTVTLRWQSIGSWQHMQDFVVANDSIVAANTVVIFIRSRRAACSMVGF